MRGDKRQRILRVLLATTDTLSKSKISKMALCSRKWVMLFLQQLEGQKLVKGTKVTDRKKLLKYWISISSRPKKYQGYMVREPMQLLKKTKLAYALTTYKGENLIHHYLFPSRIDIYIKEEDLPEWHSLLTKDGLYGSGNLRILIADNHTMYSKNKIDGLYVVSLPQLIVDLAHEGGPCQEAADMLMERLNDVQRV
jgi:hypothetical protein